MSSCPRWAAARATSSGIATSSRCSWETTGQTSATIANSRSPPRAIGSIWPSTSTTRAMTNPGAPDGPPPRASMKRRTSGMPPRASTRSVSGPCRPARSGAQISIASRARGPMRGGISSAGSPPVWSIAIRTMYPRTSARSFSPAARIRSRPDGMGGERAPAIGSVDRERLRSDDAVRSLIHDGIPDAGMPGFTLMEPELSQIIAFVRSRVTPARESMPPGDPDAGQAFFFGVGGCAQCHMMNGRGGAAGPDLSNSGSELTLAELEQSLLKPAARRKPGFRVATVRLRSGPIVRGFLRNESLYDLQVQGFDGRLYLLRRDEVAAIEREAASYMPALQ